jgi:glucose-1-phosphate adenylyltransferase
VKPELNIYDREWPIWTYQEHQPPAKFILDDYERRGMAVNSMVSGGVIISGSQVRNSLIFSDVRVDERSFVDSAVILPHVDVGRGCTIKRAIVDEGCQIPDGMSIGTDLALDEKRFHLTENGVVLVTADMLRRM